MTSKSINLLLPQALYDQIEELAEATARTKSCYLTIDALTSYMQRESWRIRDIHEGIREADAGEFATDEQVKAVFAKYGA
jgi:RHH-type rel operon transcriptional repressor/antitoxin RelB